MPIVVAQLGPRSQTVLLGRHVEIECLVETDLVEAHRASTELVETCREGCQVELVLRFRAQLAQIEWRRGSRKAALARIRGVRSEATAMKPPFQSLVDEIDAWLREHAQKP
jgi:hypothetical protein